ncbi:hypothetical protein LFM09_19955 [Lentzea alba]|uniref:hypothetical protein n=1 Tax=Lentzea alba TaxID=2714351 RepID=UPI0039BF06B0
MNITPEIPQLDPLRVQVRKHALMNEIGTRPSRKWWRIAVPATGLAAAVAIGTLLWPAANPSAFASWTAEPRAPGPDSVLASDDCRTTFGKILKPNPDALESGIPPKPAPTEQTLVDQRGNVVLTVLTGPETMGYCLEGPEYRTIGLSELSLGETWFTATLAGRTVEAAANARVLTGHVGPEVRRVRVDTADGRQVTTTLDRGWVAAWWPSAAEASLITLYDEAGHVLGTQVPTNR